MLGRVFLDWTSTKQGLMSCSRTQHSDASEAQTHNPSVSSQALYHWVTALLNYGGYYRGVEIEKVDICQETSKLP